MIEHLGLGYVRQARRRLESLASSVVAARDGKPWASRALEDAVEECRHLDASLQAVEATLTPGKVSLPSANGHAGGPGKPSPQQQAERAGPVCLVGVGLSTTAVPSALLAETLKTGPCDDPNCRSCRPTAKPATPTAATPDQVAEAVRDRR